MSVKVVDLNTEAVEEETPTLEPIEEVKAEAPEPEIVNEVIEETNEQPKEEKPKEEKPKKQTQKDRIQCPKCLKEMTVKSYRYSHEKNCGGQLTEKPVKPHSKPKAKQQAKPKQPPEREASRSIREPPPEIYYSDDDDDEDVQQQPLIKKKQQKQQPPNPLLDITNSYALLHQQLMQQRQEKYNKVCAGMSAPRVKKR